MVSAGPEMRAGRLTARDQEFLGYLGRHRMASAEQLRREWSRRGAALPHRSVYRRMQVARSFGLVVMERCLVERPAVFRVTREGLALAGLELVVPPKVSLATFDHDLAVVDLVRVLEERGAQVVTERELYAGDVSAFRRDGRSPRYCPVVQGTPAGRVDAVHVPDAVALMPSGAGEEPWAQEVELTLKSADRLDRLVSAYRDADQLAGVVYWAASDSIARAVRAAARRVWGAATPFLDGRGAEEVIRVRPLTDLCPSNSSSCAPALSPEAG